MIFEIHESCIESLEKGDSDVCTVLNNIALSRRKGHNFIIGTREVFDRLKVCEFLEANARHVYSEISRKDRVSIETYKNRVNRYYTIIADATVLCEHEFTITVAELLEKDFVQKTKFIAENLDDCKFYRNLGLFYIWKHRLNNEIISDNLPGGGHTSAPIFKSKINEQNNLLFGIFDGDQKYPQDKRGGTIQAVEKEIKDIDKKYFECCSLDKFSIHEAENLIPYFIIEKICDQRTCDSKNTLNFLNSLIESDSKESYFYFDMKEGLYLPSKDYSENYDSFWKGLVSNFYQNKATNFQVSKVVVSGGDLLKSTIVYLEKIEKDGEMATVFETIEKSIFDEKWNMLGKEIYTWFCTGKRIP